MELYISGSGNIIPRVGSLNFGEPDYEQWIDVRQLRRMSRIIKMGTAAALMAKRNSGIEQINGIITGTGYGCLEDSGTFLEKLVINNESALNPTPFIHSTHNTIGSQLALLLQNRGYNQTFTQNAFSFEHALLDAMFYLNENRDQSLLVGGADEATKFSVDILKRFFQSMNVGEGATYFVLSGLNVQTSRAKILTVRTYYKPEQHPLESSLISVLNDVELQSTDIDLVVLGESGDASLDAEQNKLLASLLSDCQVSRFKKLCGEYPVASSFALWLALKAIEEQEILDQQRFIKSEQPIRNVLIYNQYFGTHHSLILVSACQGMR